MDHYVCMLVHYQQQIVSAKGTSRMQHVPQSVQLSVKEAEKICTAVHFVGLCVSRVWFN